MAASRDTRDSEGSLPAWPLIEVTATEEEADAVAGLQDLTSSIVQRVVDIGLVLIILKGYAN